MWAVKEQVIHWQTQYNLQEYSIVVTSSLVTIYRPIITHITSLLCHDLFTNQNHYISPTLTDSMQYKPWRVFHCSPKPSATKHYYSFRHNLYFHKLITSHYITMSRFAASYFIDHGSHFPYILCGQREWADPQRGMAIIMWSYHASCPLHHHNLHCIHQSLHHKSPPIITLITSLLCHDLFTNQTHYISPTSNMVLPICSACMASSWVAWLLIQM